MFVPLHSLPPYQHAHVSGRALPVTDGLGARGIMLPTYNALSDDDIDRICDAISRIGAGCTTRAGRQAA
jgi:perosamine synthetase